MNQQKLDELEEEDGLNPRHRRSNRRQASERQSNRYPPGTLVRHERFGLGRIIQVSPSGSHTRARIQFNTAGPKTLMLEYAPVERVEQ